MSIKELHVGDAAPDFTLDDQDGHVVRLNDLRGKQATVLIFYPGDMTPGCTMQLCSIRDDWSKFQSLGVAVFGINHGSADSHHQFIERHHFLFPLLVDLDKKVSAQYGALRSIFSVTIIRRSVIGIDKDGIVRYIKRGMPKDADILKAIKTFTS